MVLNQGPITKQMDTNDGYSDRYSRIVYNNVYIRSHWIDTYSFYFYLFTSSQHQHIKAT